MRIVWELFKALFPIILIALVLWWAVKPDEIVCRGDLYSDAVCSQLDKSPFRSK